MPRYRQYVVVHTVRLNGREKYYFPKVNKNNEFQNFSYEIEKDTPIFISYNKAVEFMNQLKSQKKQSLKILILDRDGELKDLP